MDMFVDIVVLCLGGFVAAAYHYKWSALTLQKMGATLFVFLLFMAFWETDQYWPPWCLLTFGALGCLSYILYHKKLQRSAVALFTWVCFSGLVLVEFKPALEAPNIEIGQILTTKNLAAGALIEFLFLFFAFLLAWGKIRKPLATAIYFIGLAHVLSLIWDQAIAHIVTGTATIGLLGNRSIGASYAAVWVFYVQHYARNDEGEWMYIKQILLSLSAALGVFSVLISSSGISYAALLAGSAVCLVRVDRRAWIGVAALTAGGLGIASWIKPMFWSYNVRYTAWPIFLESWRKHFPPWFGSGLGTFKFWGPVAQMEAHWREGSWWLWVHCDWMQIFLELGVIGLAFAVWFYVDLLRKSYSRVFLFASVVSFGVVMLGNYPLHGAAFSLFAWWFVYEILVGDNNGVQITCSEGSLSGLSPSRQDDT